MLEQLMPHMHNHRIHAPSGASMRRTLLISSLLLLPSCTGFGEFLDHTLPFSGTNPNGPIADSENVRRVLGQEPDPAPLHPEEGNVWPAPSQPEPTLADLQNQQGDDAQHGFAPTTVPGEQPGLPAGHQPRPVGSSTPPGSVEYQPPSTPAAPSVPPPSRSTMRSPSPTGSIVQTPGGPAVDAGGTSSYRELTTPQGPGAIMVPNGNGTSTIINPNGTVQTVPTPR
jgi:hypothetical protein